MIVDRTRGKIPARARVLEGADELPLLRIDAEDGQVATLEVIAQVADVEELLVAIRTGVGGELLVVDAQRIAHLPEQAPDRVRTDGDAKVAEGNGHFGGGRRDHFTPVTGSPAVSYSKRNSIRVTMSAVFFSAGGRPPPPRRTRPGATS